MPLARKSLVDLETTLFYHCFSRCVRQAFLCGQDEATGKNLNHRRQWLVERFKFLAQYFAIDICAYAAMSNHYHLVLKVDPQFARSLSDDAVVARWTAVYKGGNVLVNRLISGEASEIERQEAEKIIDRWRGRLADISWFMRALNEYIAKRANKEDNCKGHFWDSRFKSQALLDQHAVLSCMMYVDLNPIRASIAQSLVDSDFTSIQERINVFTQTRAVEQKQSENNSDDGTQSIVFQPETLLPFAHSCNFAEQNSELNVICFNLLDYLMLADWTGRYVHINNKNAIHESCPSILDTLGFDQDDWLNWSQNFQRKFAGFAGKPAKLYQHANLIGQHHCRGVG